MVDISLQRSCINFIFPMKSRLVMAKILDKIVVFIKVVGELLFLFGFLAWIYGVTVQFTHPNWMPEPLSHLTLWIRVDTFTILSFIVSAIGFFMWRMVKELIGLRKREQQIQSVGT